MNLNEIAELLQTETVVRETAVAKLNRIRELVDELLLDLGGEKRPRPRVKGTGATREDIESAIAQVRGTEPGLNGDRLESKVREHLKASGKSLRGFGNRWKAVNGSDVA